MPSEHQADYLKPKEVADRLRVSESVIYSLLSSGEMPGMKIKGSWRISVEELAAWEQSQSNQKRKK